MGAIDVAAVALVVLALDKAGEWAHLGIVLYRKRQARIVYEQRVRDTNLECCKRAKREAEELTDLLSHPDTTLEQLQERHVRLMGPLGLLLGAQVSDDEAELRKGLWDRVKAAQEHAFQHEQEDGLHG